MSAVVALREAFTGLRRVRLAPPPTLTVSQWADRHRVVSSYSAEPGRWNTGRTPYLREIMDCFNDPRVNEVWFMKCARIGGTEAGLNIVGYFIEQDPSPILIVQPTVDDAKDFSKEQLAPMVADTPVLRDKVQSPRSRDSGNTVMSKVFPGGGLFLVGANSPRGFRRRTARVLDLEEIDGYPASAGTEGDPVRLAMRRTSTFGFRRKVFGNSTPTLRGLSRIEDQFLKSDQRRYNVGCPDCGEYQVLKWANLKYEGLTEPRYACEGCGSLIPEDQKFGMLAGGRWVATAESAIVGFHINALYSPWVSWTELVAEWKDAQGDVLKLQVFVNTVLGETWEDVRGSLDPKALESRREAYPADCPEWVSICTAGVDVQENRLVYVIRGWGHGEESALIEEGELDGDPTRKEVWAALDARLLVARTTPSGRAVPVWACGVDTGHHTESAYAYCKARYNRRVYALKGSSTPGAPLAPRKASVNNKGRVRLFLIGTMAAKDLIYGRLKVAQPGPGYYHFHEQATDNYFLELTAETLERVQINGRWHRRYKLPRGAQNHRLDCEVYALSALYLSGFNRARLGVQAATGGVPPVGAVVPLEETPAPLLEAVVRPSTPIVKRPTPLRPRGGGYRPGSW